MEELLAAIAIVVLAGYGWLVYRTTQQRHGHQLAAAESRTPAPGEQSGYLAVARDHYRMLSRWARLFEDMRRDDMVWPVVPERIRSQVERELDEFYRL